LSGQRFSSGSQRAAVFQTAGRGFYSRRAHFPNPLANTEDSPFSGSRADRRSEAGANKMQTGEDQRSLGRRECGGALGRGPGAQQTVAPEEGLDNRVCLRISWLLALVACCPT